MVNKCEKNLLYNFYFRQTAVFFLYFLILSLSFYSFFFFFPYLFRFNFVASERNVHILFCRHIWAELSLLFWTFLRSFFSSWEGAHAPSAPPTPLRTRLNLHVFWAWECGGVRLEGSRCTGRETRFSMFILLFYRCNFIQLFISNLSNKHLQKPKHRKRKHLPANKMCSKGQGAMFDSTCRSFVTWGILGMRTDRAWNSRTQLHQEWAEKRRFQGLYCN